MPWEAVAAGHQGRISHAAATGSERTREGGIGEQVPWRMVRKRTPDRSGSFRQEPFVGEFWTAECRTQQAPTWSQVASSGCLFSSGTLADARSLSPARHPGASSHGLAPDKVSERINVSVESEGGQVPRLGVTTAYSGETDQLIRSESDHPFRSLRSPQVGGRGRPTQGSGSAPDGHLLSVCCG